MMKVEELLQKKTGIKSADAAKIAAVIATKYQEALAKAGGDPAALDWSQLIDWIAAALTAIFPQWAPIIKIVAEILKQLLTLQVPDGAIKQLVDAKEE